MERNLLRVLGRARQLNATPLLLRLDSGNDAIENIAVVEAHNEHDGKGAPVYSIIKWNPRKESPEKWLAYAEEYGHWREPPRASASLCSMCAKRAPTMTTPIPCDVSCVSSSAPSTSAVSDCWSRDRGLVNEPF